METERYLVLTDIWKDILYRKAGGQTDVERKKYTYSIIQTDRQEDKETDIL